MLQKRMQKNIRRFEGKNAHFEEKKSKNVSPFFPVYLRLKSVQWALYHLT